ncbi:MAG: hypothetical protein IPM55_19585 [Acidobacteria bacterium]|nr:hypothetical protein [Acidobacteriota bacterium]
MDQKESPQLNFWQCIKTMFPKHLGLLIAGALVITSLVALSVPYCHSTDRRDLLNDFLLNLGTEILGMAMTIFFVERLLAWRDKRERILSVKPSARHLLIAFQSLRVAYDRYLTAAVIPPPDAIERYRAALRQAVTIATRLSTLVDEHQLELASKLASYVGDAESQFAYLENAATAVQYAAADAVAHIERLKNDGQRLLELSDEVRSQVCAIYALSTELSQEKN